MKRQTSNVKRQTKAKLLLCFVFLILCPLASAEELRDIRGPVGIPGEWLWLWGLVAILFLAGLVTGIVLWKKKRRALLEVKEPPRPAWEVALEALASLEQGPLMAQGRVKEFYSLLSGIVRYYIEARFEIRAPEMTTEEFMAAVQSSDKLTPAQHLFLKDFLSASDLVKFAKFVPSIEDMKGGLGLARRFVKETKAAEQENGDAIRSSRELRAESREI